MFLYIYIYNTGTPDDHYSDVIMSAVATKIAEVSSEYSTVNSGASQRKHQSPAWLAFVRGIQLWPADSSHKRSVTRKMFSFDDVRMTCTTWVVGMDYRWVSVLLSNCRWLTSEKAESKTATIFSKTKQSLYSPSGRTSYRQISWATRFLFRFFQSLKNGTSTSAAVLLICLSFFLAMRSS